MGRKIFILFGMSICCAMFGFGCSTSVGTKGNTALRSYPVPIEFHVAEGAYNNTQ